MKICHLCCFCLLLFWTVSGASQNWEKKGHQQFQEMAYSDAIKSLEKAVEQGRGNPQIYAELADSYYFNANYTASAKWFQLLFNETENNRPDHFFRFSQVLKSIGKYDEAQAILTQMTLLYPDQSVDFADSQDKKMDFKRCKIQLAHFNSTVADFGASFYGSQIVFASARDTSGVFTRKHSWTNHSFTDLYAVDSDSADAKPIRFAKSINSKFNESSAVFTKDGLTMYFTRNNFENNKRGTNFNQTTLLSIYKAEKKGSEWTVVGALPFCSDLYSVAHPALSADEKTLYFASDMPGGFGASDLYQVEVEPNGTFGIPKNLGSVINTQGRETFPFISDADELYFASDGHNGFGGLDIFVSIHDGKSNFNEPQNVGLPINSQVDDFGFIIDSTTKKGFFTSNRSGGEGMDDIYAFDNWIPISFTTILQGTVIIQNPEETKAGIAVLLFDAQSNQIDQTTTDASGKYQFSVDGRKKYTIKMIERGYTSAHISINPTRYSTAVLEKIFIEKEKTAFELGDDLAKKLSLQPIYFDLSKSIIREDAAKELAKIKKVLVENPNLSIEIRSHTDSRDSFENNQILSDQRAQATLTWLLQNGIDSSRLKAKGYGETQLINQCADEFHCTETEHQLNRRSEFIVTRI
jgi:outer membrane protein OmpA-like peptidoglycan-associated protein/tetratricopeptide (TPR) repeat protein